MTIPKDLIRTLREQTGAGIVDIKRAVETVGDDPERVVALLRKQGKKVAMRKADRHAREGTIGSYVHANGKIAAFVAVGCETDFVGRNERFQELAHDLAMHVAAANPEYLSPEDVPAHILGKEKEIAEGHARSEKKPKAVIEKIVQGKLEKFFDEHCLLRQRFIKDDTQTITDLVEHATATLGEKIEIRRFIRMQL
jgi:elongation factor Ts